MDMGHVTEVTRSCARRTATFVVYILSVKMVQQKRILIPYLLWLVKKGSVNSVILLCHCFVFGTGCIVDKSITS